MTNISAYHFAPMEDLSGLRERLLKFCRGLQLKGTILLAPEGINLFVAGPHLAIEELVFELRSLPGLSHLQPKYSESEEQPFTRMLVRIKREIIAFGVEGIDPAGKPAPRIKPRQLKEWLDSGREIVLLDTRNDYEIKLGTFRDALPAGIHTFREFPAAVEKLPEELKGRPVVTFCTGGIRCEKAAPLMEQLGFREVYQLDGGILKYFEDVGGDHYEGECFVFDHRVGLDPALRESGAAVCFTCQTPLTPEEAEDPRHVAGESCPYCFQPDEVKRRARIAKHQRALDALACELPGAVPCDNLKPIRIPEVRQGLELLDALDKMFPHFGREEWRELIESGRLISPEGEPAPVDRIVQAGEQYARLLPQDIEPPVNGEVRVIAEDDALLVIDKPAPLPMHPCGRFRRNTLEHFLRRAWDPEVPRPAHRLDANTRGVVVCARTRHFARLIQPAFARGEVEKEYLARVIGHPSEDAGRIEARISAEPGPLGSRVVDEKEGLDALTEFRVVMCLADGTALLHLNPRTGRTNQIRVHLWHLGHPIVGDPVYLENGALGERQTLSPDDPPLCLCAWRIQLQHPLEKREVSYEASLPEWWPGECAP